MVPETVAVAGGVYDSGMSYSRANQQTGRIDPADWEQDAPNGSGPLHRRIQAGAQSSAPAANGATAPEPWPRAAIQYATVALLDGTVVGRLECDGSLGQVMLGRGSLAGIRVHDPFVHRVHSEIRWDSDLRAHVIAHAGGSNPTFVNLERVDKPTRLIDGARIRVGKTELIYRRAFYPGS
jgi:hypothetical protein